MRCLENIVGALVFSIACAIAHAAEYTADPRNYAAAVKKLAPGDTLFLAPGIYGDGLDIHGLRGYRSQPIQIRAADPNRRPHFYGREDRNTVSIRDSEYVHIEGLMLDGRGFDTDGIKAEGDAKFAHNITLENLLIVNHGATQQTVGISTKCPAWGWIVRGNQIFRAGTGMYFGDSDGSAPFVAGVIENNVVRDTIGYNLQIKHQKVRPTDVGLPAIKMVSVIRRNVFSKAEFASTGEDARPNVLVGKPPATGPGSEDVVLIYGNFFLRNSVEALFQGEGNLAIYNNVFWNLEGSGIHIQPHKGTPDTVDVFNNTVLAKENGIKLIGGNAQETQRIFGNAVFAGVPITGGDKTANIIGSLDDARNFLARPIGPIEQVDFSPKAPLLQSSVSAKQALPNYIDVQRDFEGNPRKGTVIGAFATQSSKWRPSLDFLPPVNR